MALCISVAVESSALLEIYLSKFEFFSSVTCSDTICNYSCTFTRINGLRSNHTMKHATLKNDSWIPDGCSPFFSSDIASTYKYTLPQLT